MVSGKISRKSFLILPDENFIRIVENINIFITFIAINFDVSGVRVYCLIIENHEFYRPARRE
jgi:hypothetical protein